MSCKDISPRPELRGGGKASWGSASAQASRETREDSLLGRAVVEGEAVETRP